MEKEKSLFRHPAAYPFVMGAMLSAVAGSVLFLLSHGFTVSSFDLPSFAYLILGYGFPILAILAATSYVIGSKRGFRSTHLLSLYLFLAAYLLYPGLLYFASPLTYGSNVFGSTPETRPFTLLMIGAGLLALASLLEIVGLSISYRKNKNNLAAILAWLAFLSCLGGISVIYASIVDVYDSFHDFFGPALKEYGYLITMLAPFLLTIASLIYCPKEKEMKDMAPLEAKKIEEAPASK